MQHRAEVWDPERKAALGGARDAALRDGDEGSDALDLAGVHRKTARETEVRELAAMPVGDGGQSSGDGGRSERPVYLGFRVYVVS